MKGILLALAVLLAASSLSAQETVTITATQDNTLYQDPEGLLSNGAGSYLFVGRTNQGSNNLRRALVKFDLTGKLPDNAVISWAKLKMNMDRSNTGPIVVTVHRVLGDWGEGTSNADANEGKGAPASANDATWTHRYNGSQPWILPGGDFSPLASATLSVDAIGSYEWQDTLLWADVMIWQLLPAANFGWIVTGNEAVQSSKRFVSRNNSTVADRPKLTIEYTVPTSVHGAASIPDEFVLKQNYPNPFNPSTSIAFTLPQGAFTKVAVFDVLGNNVATLVNRFLPAGPHTVKFDGTRLTSGIYFYRLESGLHTATKKLMLLK